MHYYQHNIADYRKDTIHLSLLEHGIYRQLLDWYYLNEKPLPLDKDTLMRTQCVRNADEESAMYRVLNDFFFATDDGYIHKRCDTEIDAYHAKSKAASESAKARWAEKNKKKQEDNKENDDECERNANAMRTQCERNANSLTHKPLTNKLIKEHIDTSCLFAQFWAQYPKRKDKAKCLVKFEKKVTSPEVFDLIIQAIENQKREREWKTKAGQFVPEWKNPLTWLNGECWEDEVEIQPQRKRGVVV